MCVSHFCKSFLMKIATAIYDVEEATSTAFGIILDHKVKKLTLSLSWIPLVCMTQFYIFGPQLMQMIRSGTRASLIKFLQLLVAHHPSKRLAPTFQSFVICKSILCLSLTCKIWIFLLGAGREVQIYWLTLIIYVRQRYCQ